MDNAVVLSFNERVNTFDNWPSRDTMDVILKAKAGFYFPAENTIDGKGDRLQCAFCPCSIANWTQGDDPWKEHALSVPRCLHVMCCKGTEFISMVVQVENQNTENSFQTLSTGIPHYKAAEEVTLYGTSGPFTWNHHCAYSTYIENSPYTTPRGISFKRPLNANYGEFKRRLATFGNMPYRFRKNLPLQQLHQLADSGQWYEGPGDKTRCYYCGVGFQNWDPGDDPWKEHARFAPTCCHILLVKGEDYIFHVMDGLAWDPSRQNQTEDVYVHQNLRHRIDDNNQGHDNKRRRESPIQAADEKERHPPIN